MKTSSISLDTVVGRAAIVDLIGIQPNSAITEAHIRGAVAHIKPGDIVLMKICWDTARFYPESEIDFRRQFAVDRLTFSKAGRRVTHLTLEQDGVEAQADRIQAEPESIREDCYAEGVFYQPERP